MCVTDEISTFYTKILNKLGCVILENICDSLLKIHYYISSKISPVSTVLNPLQLIQSKFADIVEI